MRRDGKDDFTLLTLFVGLAEEIAQDRNAREQAQSRHM